MSESEGSLDVKKLVLMYYETWLCIAEKNEQMKK